MVTSLRLNEELERLLNAVVQRTGHTQSDVIRVAVKKYCLELLNQSKYSLYDKLTDSNFRPLELNSTDLSTNKETLRRQLRERAARDNS